MQLGGEVLCGRFYYLIFLFGNDIEREKKYETNFDTLFFSFLSLSLSLSVSVSVGRRGVGGVKCDRNSLELSLEIQPYLQTVKPSNIIMLVSQ